MFAISHIDLVFAMDTLKYLYIYKNEHVSTLNVPMFPLCMYVPSSRLVLLMSRCPVYVCPELAGRSWYEMFVCYRMSPEFVVRDVQMSPWSSW